MLCWLAGKFPETYRQPVSSLTAVEDPSRAVYANTPAADPAKTLMQTGTVTTVEPAYVPGLRWDIAADDDDDDDDYGTHAAGMPKKEFGTQTGM